MRSTIVFFVGSSAIFHFTRAIPLPAPAPPAASQSDISSHLSSILNQISHAIPINTIPTSLAANPPNKAGGPPNKVVANPKAVLNPKYSTPSKLVKRVVKGLAPTVEVAKPRIIEEPEGDYGMWDDEEEEDYSDEEDDWEDDEDVLEDESIFDLVAEEQGLPSRTAQLILSDQSDKLQPPAINILPVIEIKPSQRILKRNNPKHTFSEPILLTSTTSAPVAIIFNPKSVAKPTTTAGTFSTLSNLKVILGSLTHPGEPTATVTVGRTVITLV